MLTGVLLKVIDFLIFKYIVILKKWFEELIFVSVSVSYPLKKYSVDPHAMQMRLNLFDFN